jgi:hypothetical protein
MLLPEVCWPGWPPLALVPAAAVFQQSGPLAQQNDDQSVHHQTQTALQAKPGRRSTTTHSKQRRNQSQHAAAVRQMLVHLQAAVIPRVWSKKWAAVSLFISLPGLLSTSKLARMVMLLRACTAHINKQEVLPTNQPTNQPTTANTQCVTHLGTTAQSQD